MGHDDAGLGCSSSGRDDGDGAAAAGGLGPLLRRQALLLASAALSWAAAGGPAGAAAGAAGPAGAAVEAAGGCREGAWEALAAGGYAGPGPCEVSALPRLEHTAASAQLVAADASSLLLRIDVTYPKARARARALGARRPRGRCLFTPRALGPHAAHCRNLAAPRSQPVA